MRWSGRGLKYKKCRFDTLVCDGNGTFQKGYGWRPNGIWGTNPVFMKEGNNHYFYHNDHLGTPQKLTDSSGEVVWSAEYEAFGQRQQLWFQAADLTEGLVASMTTNLTLTDKTELYGYLWDNLYVSEQELLQDPQATTERKKAVLAQLLNRVLAGPKFYTAARFQDISLPPATSTLLSADPVGSPLVYLNRLLLEAAFGQLPKTSTVEKVVNNLRFPGQYWDEETGLHYNWHRYYDPGTGRYISKDPIGFRGGLNAYAYVGGNPLYYYDVMGLKGICPPEKEKFFRWLYCDLKKMSDDLGIPVEFAFILAAKEGGWLAKHLEHNMPLNNPFGVNKIKNKKAAGNKKYSSVTEAVNDWVNTGAGIKFGDRIRGVKNKQDFIDKLLCKDGECLSYNSDDPIYWETEFKKIKIDNWMAKCKCVIDDVKEKCK